MSIRIQNLIVLRFAILALLAGVSFDSVAGYKVGNGSVGWNTPFDACYVTRIEACAAMVYSGTESPAPTFLGTVTSSYCNMSNGQIGTSSCSSLCPEGQVRSASGQCVDSEENECPSGQEFDSAIGECRFITSCPSGQSLFTTTIAGGVTASARCVPNISTPGQQCKSYQDMQTAFCRGQATTCSSSGGTFGNINGNNVCIPAGPEPLPTCASGSTEFVTNSNGSKTPTCVGTSNISGAGTNVQAPKGVVGGTAENASTTVSGARTANNTAEIARINASGFEAIVNAINGKPVGGSGSGEGEGEGEGEEGEAGPCDPEQENYAECIGQTEEAADTEKDSIIDSASAGVETALDGAKDEILEMLNADSGAEGPDAVTTSIGNMIPNSVGSCSDLSMTFKGHVLTISCAKLEPLRDILAWVFALGTAIYCFQIAFAPRVA